MLTISQWTLHTADFGDLPCQAPCSLYSVLLDAHRIPDPFQRCNDRLLTKLSDRDCSFTAVFTVPEDLLGRDHVELHFGGLDTICAIYLNDRLLDRVQNMHRSYTYEVKGRLQPGENTLRLDFSSPTRYCRDRNARHYLYSDDGPTLPGAAHLRKALYMSGWDWGPALPDMGIWRPVTLRAYDRDRFDTVQLRQHHHDGVVDVELDVRTCHGTDCRIYAQLDGRRILLDRGHGVITVRQPRLWWVRGYGDQPLYDLDLTLEDENGRVLDRTHRLLGLRTLTLSTAPDPDGKGSEFCFVLNGVKIFAMGANYIPQDSLLPRIDQKALEQAVDQAVFANFNTLRVWGGGFYPDDEFFTLCDRRGILLWLDFMVACANVRLTAEFEAQCMAEAAEQLQRLHHHPCLGLLCGNNEMELAVMTWGIGNSQLVREDYIRLYERLLPAAAEQYAPDLSYWPSSPSSGGGFDDPGSFSRGDTHFWEVWHGDQPFTAYRDHDFRFCSEYGFESFPSCKTIDYFCPPSEQNCFSEIMEDHQKCLGGNGKILRYLSQQYLYPTSLEALVYASQLLQAEAIRCGVEHFRRIRGRCMGSVYWQFNDCWPVASWSGVDYFGRFKALHYAARHFYAPVALGLFPEDGRLILNVSNERREPFRGTLRLRLCRNDFTVLDSRDLDVAVSPLQSADVLTYLLPDRDPAGTFVSAELLDGGGQLLHRRTFLSVPDKYYRWTQPAITVTARDIPGGVALAVSADRFCRSVELDFDGADPALSDNFFDLTAPEPYEITARTDLHADELLPLVRTRSVWDIR